MGRDQSNKNTIKESTTRDLKALGLYHPGYERVIGLYAGLWEQYTKLSKDLDTMHYKARSTAVITCENLRRDILHYATQLGLTPAACRKLQEAKPQQQSRLEVLMGNGRKDTG